MHAHEGRAPAGGKFLEPPGVWPNTAPVKRAVLLLALWSLARPAPAAPAPQRPPGPGDRMWADYFRAETATLAARGLADVQTLADWQARAPEYRRQLQDMLGLLPWPERTDLKPVITGRLEREEFVVEKLHFQSLPGLYVTANLYLPKGLTRPAPAILYVCGHGRVFTNGVSCGNKTAYQHHGAWFARHGYVCLLIDTIQLGEIEGEHHGTYRHDQWWWNARGYTPAGVEAWNGIRALDYLATRTEVDATRFGLTGRSGGGAYTWTIAALDDRVKAAAPVAGITDLQNYVVDGCIEGHCDCMFFVNTHRWDYPLLAALTAPRPLLLGNSDKDNIFPLDGVLRVHEQVRRVYELHRAATNLGLLITEGPHKDTQDLQVPVFRWFNRWLKAEDPPIEAAATKFFSPLELRVFDTLPADALNTNIQETFARRAAPMPAGLGAEEQARWREARRAQLRQRCFAAWPDSEAKPEKRPVVAVERGGVRFAIEEFESQPGVRLRLYSAGAGGRVATGSGTLRVLGAEDFEPWLAALRCAFEPELTDELTAAQPAAPARDDAAWTALAASLRQREAPLHWLAPRGVGLTAWTADPGKARQVRRRFMLLGQTVDGMRVWDILAAVRALRPASVAVEASGEMGVNALYAALCSDDIRRLELADFPASHRQGPDYLNVLQVWDLPDALAAAKARCEVSLR